MFAHFHGLFLENGEDKIKSSLGVGGFLLPFDLTGFIMLSGFCDNRRLIMEVSFEQIFLSVHEVSVIKDQG